MSKLYLRKATLFLQSCTIFTVFVTAQLLWQFEPSNNSKSIPKLQIRQQDKRFDDENVVLHAGHIQQIFSQYCRLPFSADLQWRIETFAFFKELATFCKMFADNTSPLEWDKFC
jgi:hypothetical protein